jgi:hypothetical protein
MVIRQAAKVRYGSAIPAKAIKPNDINVYALIPNQPVVTDDRSPSGSRICQGNLTIGGVGDEQGDGSTARPDVLAKRG